ncbi:60S acidic ribosomal protein P3-like [Phoenix dactylifera]|uniref:60S acidic ribosomal protein P3-like n=1 Tax=Phoenix dactylifera TaxID=42345 RepID=A0A8B7CL07_PHODC|nr:60S acidic ribosomal protein P3-like [Phoenix dactylifera]
MCRSSSAEWSAKQLFDDLEVLASSTYELQRKLVQAALAADLSGGVTSFSMVSHCSTVFLVIIGGGGGGAFIGASAAGAAAAGFVADGAAPGAPPAEEEEKVESSDEDWGLSPFDKISVISQENNMSLWF